MKITLDIDPTSLSSEVSEFIKTLSEEDKNNMIKQVVSQYYSDYRKFEDGEFALKEREIIERIRSNISSYYKDQYDTDEKVRKSHEYIKAKNEFKTFSQKTREEISNTIRIKLSENIKEFIEKDETYISIIKESMEAVKERFPIMVQAAMIQHLNSQLPNIQSLIANELSNFYGRLTQVEQKLLR